MSEHEMHTNPARATELVSNLTSVLQRIASANKTSRPVRLIAVSKLHPANDILAILQTTTPPARQLDFGENYLQELQDKAALLPRDVRWHFIGALQTNKCRPLAESVPNLWCVSSVDTAKKADALDRGRAAAAEREALGERLRVMVQVNTSGEEEKSGVEPGDALELCRHVREKCPHLQLAGLMTIGAIARSRATTAETENEDFVRLKETRDEVAKGLGLADEDLELSMGMSADFEGAVALGSNEVRVGTTIFGTRPPRKDANVKSEAEQGSA